MIKTYGLTHIALKVKDIVRSSNFYKKVFGAKEMYNSNGFVQIQTPDTRDLIVFEQADPQDDEKAPVMHFGFRLVEYEDLEELVKIVEGAGGRVKEKGEFSPGEPYVFVYDPDGNEVEIWYERLHQELPEIS